MALFAFFLTTAELWDKVFLLLSIVTLWYYSPKASVRLYYFICKIWSLPCMLFYRIS